MDKEDCYALIEKKIDGTLTPEEQIIFDHQMQTDSEFVQAYQLQTAVIHHFRQHRRGRLHQELEAGYQASKIKQVRRRLLYYCGAIAASILLMIVIGTYILFKPSQSEILYETYYHPFRGAPVLRSALTDSYSEGAYFYQMGNYSRALPKLRKQLTYNHAKDTLQLMIGNSYLNIDEVDSAIWYFRQVTDAEDDTLRQYGQWYLALAYLKSDNTNSANMVLSEILKSQGLYYDDAKEILQELSE